MQSFRVPRQPPSSKFKVQGSKSRRTATARSIIPRSAFRVPRSLVPALLAWFATAARDLPWRRTLDPYAIWVSEIMLQQTQVKTVIPYWERWLRDLPTIAALAHAAPERILKLWEGLGYYSRARNLQKAAQKIVAESGGRFPDEFAAVLALPGIGRYTAGAICSIAFNRPFPILDGNVIRLLTRLFGIRADPHSKATNAHLWQLAEQLVLEAASLPPAGHCSHLNQALMELGALICTPRQPRCDLCPVRKSCVARRDNLTDQLPQLRARPPITQQRFIAFVVEKRGRFLVRQRPTDAVNGGLWEFPNLKIDREPVEIPVLVHNFLGADEFSGEPLCTIKHSITRYRIQLEAHHVELPPDGKFPRGRWLKPADLLQLAFASAHRKILQRLLTHH